MGNETDLRAFEHFQLGERIENKIFSTWAPAITGLLFGIGYLLFPFFRETGHEDSWYFFGLIASFFVFGLIFALFPIKTDRFEYKIIGAFFSIHQFVGYLRDID